MSLFFWVKQRLATKDITILNNNYKKFEQLGILETIGPTAKKIEMQTKQAYNKYSNSLPAYKVFIREKLPRNGIEPPPIDFQSTALPLSYRSYIYLVVLNTKIQVLKIQLEWS